MNLIANSDFDKNRRRCEKWRASCILQTPDKHVGGVSCYAAFRGYAYSAA